MNLPLDSGTLPLFALASLAMLVTPGPAVMYIVARSLEGGRLAGFVAMCGITLGGFVHVLLAAGGVAALLVASPLAFSGLRYLGIAYLAYLGLRTLITAPRAVSSEQMAAPPALAPLFWEGVLVNLTNPKTMLFILAFIPQFADPARGSLALQVLLLGLIFESLGFLTDGAYAMAAGSVRQWLRTGPGSARALRIFSGSVLLILALAALLAVPG